MRQQDRRAAMGQPKAPLDRAALRAILGYAKPHWVAITAGALLGAVGAMVGLVQPLAAKWLVDDLGHDRPLAGTLMLLGGLVLVGGVVSAFGQYVLARTAESVVLAARRGLVTRMLRLSVSAVDRTEPGDLMARVTSDTTLLRQVTTQSLVTAVTGTLTILAAIVMMGFTDVVLLGVTLVVLALVIVVMVIVSPRIARATKKAQEAVGIMGAALERMLGAFRTVKASGVEHREGQRIDEAANESWRAGVRAAKWQSLLGVVAGLSVQVSFLAVLGVGGARVASGNMSVAELVAFLLYLFYLLPPIGQLVNAINQLQVGAAAISRIREVEDMEVEPQTLPAALPAPGTEPASVIFDDVTFRYREELPSVHDGVSFSIPARGMTAFVGPSGAGKTTVFALIERFYDATGGTVSLDGRDVRDWSIGELRAAIGYVEQDSPVLSGSLRENLTFGAPDTTDDELAEVLHRTRLESLVARLPQGLETLVGHRGSRLSGGERQRVAIARALLRRPRLLLLDEATSQLDAVNEAALRDTVAEAARTTTVLVVAHRLSTVTMADRIVVMDAGKVRAVGTHAELVASDPLYGELAATQFLATAG